MLRRALAWLLAGVISAGAFPYATSTLVHSNASFSASYADFDWVWSEVDQIQASARFVAITNSTNMVRFRLAFPQSGPSYLTLDSGSVAQSSGLNWSLLITNQLPPRSYFAEFQLISNNVAIRTLAKGRVNVQSSVFGGTNAAIYTILKELPGYVVTNGMTNVSLQGTFSGTFDVTNLPGYLRTSDVDNVTVLFSNGVLTVPPGASTIDAVARAAIIEEINRAQVAEAALGVRIDVVSNLAGTAYGWGDHATNGYLTPSATQDLVTASITGGLASISYVDASTNGLIRGAVYAAQDGITTNDGVLSFGTNIFGGGGDLTVATNTFIVPSYDFAYHGYRFGYGDTINGLFDLSYLIGAYPEEPKLVGIIDLPNRDLGSYGEGGEYPSTNRWTMNGGFIATNAGAAGGGYYAMSNGAWTVFTPGSGTGGGAAQSPWTNNVDAAGYSLTGANNVTATNSVTANNGVLTGNGSGWLFTNAASGRVLYWDGTNFASRAP